MSYDTTRLLPAPINTDADIADIANRLRAATVEFNETMAALTAMGVKIEFGPALPGKITVSAIRKVETKTIDY